MPAKKDDEAPPSTRPATFIPDPAPGEPHRMRQVGPEKVDMTGFGDGTFTKLGEPPGSEPYKLKIIEDDPHGQTHHLKNQEHFWSGTAEQFKAQFEKK
jgi:hypothetical protein